MSEKVCDIVVEGLYSDGKLMRKTEVIFELAKASLAGGYRHADRAIEMYNSLVKEGIFVEKSLKR